MQNQRRTKNQLEADQAFLQKVRAVVEKHMEDERFNGKTLSREVGLSYSQIHRKLRGLAQPPVRQFIRAIRLRRACAMLQRNSLPVTEIAYRTGFRNPAYFTKYFREALGCTPRQFRQKIAAQYK